MKTERETMLLLKWSFASSLQFQRSIQNFIFTSYWGKKTNKQQPERKSSLCKQKALFVEVILTSKNDCELSLLYKQARIQM